MQTQVKKDVIVYEGLAVEDIESAIQDDRNDRLDKCCADQVANCS